MPPSSSLWENGGVNQDVKILHEFSLWFERQKRVLPWRSKPTVYRVWISEIMLQQTQVITVIPYFEKFIAKFPTVQKLARASEDQVMKYWAGLGYYSRARNLHRGAKMIVAQKGQFPQTREQWLEIPGVGNYTAGAILSIAYDQPEAILDGNVERVLARLGKIENDKHLLWRISEKSVQFAYSQGVRPSVFNQAMMELGATVCTPKNPKCQICPFASVCKSKKDSCQDQYPQKKKSKKWIEVREEICFYFDRTGRVLLQKCENQKWRKGLWDGLPQKLKAEGKKFKKLGSVQTRHIVTRHKIQRISHVFQLKTSGWQVSEEGFLFAQWVSAHDLSEVPTGSAFKKTWAQIREKFPGVLRQS